MESLSDRLKRLRKMKGWTLEETAKRLGLRGYSTYSNWEYGRTEPDSNTLSKIAETFGVSTDFLINGEEHQPGNNSLDETIQLIEDEAKRLGLSPRDPVFKKMLSDAFDMLRIARGKNSE